MSFSLRTIVFLSSFVVSKPVETLLVPRDRFPNGLVDVLDELDLVDETILEPRIVQRAGDPTDFSWIKRWAAVGDSFTAGIGSGSPLGSFLYSQADWSCSRYDRSYPEVLNRAFGKSVEDFQFVACSGDRTEQIYTQVQNMDGDLDLVIMTAGGNDLCLVREPISMFPSLIHDVGKHRL